MFEKLKKSVFGKAKEGAVESTLTMAPFNPPANKVVDKGEEDTTRATEICALLQELASLEEPFRWGIGDFVMDEVGQIWNVIGTEQWYNASRQKTLKCYRLNASETRTCVESEGHLCDIPCNANGTILVTKNIQSSNKWVPAGMLFKKDRTYMAMSDEKGNVRARRCDSGWEDMSPENFRWYSYTVRDESFGNDPH